MKSVVAALLAALLLSGSDMCSDYALKRGLTNIRHCFWSHGVTYALALAFAIWFVSKPGQLASNISFPENRLVGFSSVLAGCFAFAALLVINYAFSKSQNIGYTVALISTTSVFTLVLSAAMFKNPLQRRGTIGLCVTLTGVWLISGCANDR